MMDVTVRDARPMQFAGPRSAEVVVDLGDGHMMVLRCADDARDRDVRHVELRWLTPGASLVGMCVADLKARAAIRTTKMKLDLVRGTRS